MLETSGLKFGYFVVVVYESSRYLYQFLGLSHCALMRSSIPSKWHSCAAEPLLPLICFQLWLELCVGGAGLPPPQRG